MWNTAFKNYEVKAPCYLKTFKGFLPQSLLGPFLNTLSQLATLSKEIHYEYFLFWSFHSVNSNFKKIVCICSFSAPYFPAFEMNMEIYGVSFRIHSKCGKTGTRENPNTGTFHAVPEVHLGASQTSMREIYLRKQNPLCFIYLLINTQIQYLSSDP